MEGEAEKERAMDELPQAAAGKTIMTTEPKFIPQQAAEIRLSDFKTEEEPLKLRVRLIDCVGFLADGAVGHMEGNGSRMVKTPWSDQEILTYSPGYPSDRSGTFEKTTFRNG